MPIEVKLPPLFAINITHNGNTIQQIIKPSHSIMADKGNFTSTGIKGQILIPQNTDSAERILVLDRQTKQTLSFTKIILTGKQKIESSDILDLSSSKWIKHPDLKEPKNHTEHLGNTIKSWSKGFSFLSEDEENGIFGLREPQEGAIHEIKGHWSVTNDTATIVMPTGTGKTETMISVSVLAQCEKILIVVPTDALRTQIAQKFLTFGVLKEFGVIGSSCLYPIVGILKSRPKTVEEVDEFFTKCSVIVTTSHIAGQSDNTIQERIAHHCSNLFIDEAHHVSADTWKSFKKQFESKRILQFTATPFREDDKPVEGKIIFKYPLTRAQEKGYFKKINFKPVRIFARKKRDRAIAELAVKQLREDLKTYNHILMARVNTIDRAKEVFEIYKQYEEFNPVQIHTGIKSKKERDEIREKLLTGQSRIVVCVDMLGEGFDLPELKIAAFHDIKKSPTITIQLAGRFTRTRSDLGDATFIANVGDEEVRSELKKLYRREPDWNLLLPELSEELIQEELDLNDFAEGFTNFPKEIPIQSLSPALSTVIYKTKCKEWTPDNFIKGLVGADSFEKKFYDINEENNTLIIITTQKVPVKWTKIEEIFNWDWNLYVVFWDKVQNLLFINNSSNKGDFKKLAQAVAGDDAELIRGEVLFRCLGNINRMTFKNIGLSEHLGRMVSYTGRMGSDVEPVLTELQKQRASKSVLDGSGFENGQRTSIGCSSKGRVWSHARSYRLNRLIEWFSATGAKILDDTIDPNDFLKNTLASQFISERPPIMPFGIGWHEDIYKTLESAITFKFDDKTERQLYEVDINLVEPTTDGELKFEVVSEDINSQFTLNLIRKGEATDYAITNTSEKKLVVEWGTSRISGETFFYDYPPTIWFVNGSELSGDKFIAPVKRLEPFPRARILTRKWKDLGVNIKKESQRIEKRADSIQYAMIQELLAKNYDVIFDDDSSGEAADVVAIKVDDAHRTINVEFYHCKFSTEEQPGARIKELYEVCGQSQKSIRWIQNARELFYHLLRREEKRQDEDSVSRIEKGDFDKIEEILEKSSVYKTELAIFIVQPGLSKAKASSEQLELLSVTESYLKETYMIPLGIIASE
jgi:superfamily II DNA or RNA helicase